MPLHHYVPQDRLRALALGVELPERSDGATLFADISGFTALTEALRVREGERRGIETLSRRINAIFDTLLAEVQAQGGSVIGFAGDAVTCWFDESHGNPGLHAVLAAREMQAAMARFPELALKVCVASGPARRFAVGHPEVQRIDVLAGPTLNRVAAADALARAGELLVETALASALALPFLDRRLTAEGHAFAVVDTAASWSVGSAALTPASAGHVLIPDDELLRSWVPPFVFERETAATGLFVTDLRPATAVFIRLGGLEFDDDGHDAALLDDVVSQAQLAMRLHGGVLLELTVGDKGCYLYGNFGAAQAHEDDPARAVRAALALRHALADRPVALQVGISTGTMRVGGYGGSDRQSFGAIGDDVNTAARLMALADSGEILVSGRARQTLGDEFELDARPPLQAKGKAEPMPVFAVRRARARRSIRLQEPSWNTPIVGRGAEVAGLAEGVATAKEGRGSLIAFVAEAGMGKSRLVAEGVRLALAEGFIGFGGCCSMDGIRTPYLVWQPIWNAFFDVDPGLPLRRQLRTVHAVLQRHAPERAEAAPLLGAVLGLDWPDNDFTRALQPKDRRALLEELLLQCLVAAAEEATADGIGLLLVLEDLHAADPLSLDLLLLVARAVEHLPVLVLLSLRPDAGDSPASLATTPTDLLQTLAHCVQVEPRALPPAQIEEMIHAKLGALFPERSGPLNSALVRRITERAQGNPFFVEELLSYLRDQGLDPRSADSASLLELPASLHSLVLSRIDRLPLLHRQILKVASVIGRVFTTQALLDYYPALGDKASVRQALQELDALGLTPRDPDPSDQEDRHVFQHRVTQEVAYTCLTETTLVELHARYAAYLQGREAEGQAVQAAELARHYQRAGVPLQAAKYLAKAGEEAAARYANEEALDLLSQALQHLPAEDHAGRHALLLQCEAVLALLGRHEARQRHLAELDLITPLLPEPVLTGAQVAIRRARLQMDLGDHTAAGAFAAAAIHLLEPAALAPAGNAAAQLLVDALREQARTIFFGGHAGAARPQLDRALVLARAEGYRRGEINILSLLGLVHWQTGDLESAQTCLNEALSLMDTGGEVRRQLDTLNNLGVIASARGQHEQALGHYEAALAMARRIGDRNGQAMLLNNLGDVCLARCDFHQAMLHTQAAGQMYGQAGEPVSQGAALLNLAAAYGGLGQYHLALETSAKALELLRRGRQRRGEAAVLSIMSSVSLALAQPVKAAEHARQALALAREIGSPDAEHEALIGLGRALTAQGAWIEAVGVLEQAASALEDVEPGPKAMEAAMARAEYHLAQGGGDAARHAHGLIESLVLREVPEPGLGVTSPPFMTLPAWGWLVTWRCMQALGDPRATVVLGAVCEELMLRAASIPNPRLRHDYLALAEHRELLAARSLTPALSS